VIHRWNLKLLVVIFGAALAAHAADPLTAQRLSGIAPRLQELVDSSQIPGAVFLVAHNGETLLLQAVGHQSLEPRQPMRADSIFQVMSMTKPITAAGLMMLVEEGKVVLTEPVDKYLPEFRDQPAATGEGTPAARPQGRRRMTVYQLLTHTNGMTDPAPERRQEIQCDLGLSLADAVKYYATLALRFEPGTRWAYSNIGLATAGRIIEVVSGIPYERFIAQRILEPLGMKDSFYFPDEARIPRIAMLYRAENGKLVLPGRNVLGGDPTKFRQGAKYPAPEFGLYSTAADLAAFYQMMLDGGTYRGRRYLSKSSVDVMTALHTGNLETFNPGFGNGLAFTVPRDAGSTLDLLSAESFGHAGAFGTWSFADKSKHLVGVMLIQLTGPNNTTAQHVFTAMVEAAVDGTK
jgi:CubicO group peptidase (beta-lactamase class C family)